MRVDHLRLIDFRSFREKELSPGDVTVLAGANASGKTNLIEAVRLATATTSFRNPTWTEVVRWGAGKAAVEVTATGQSSHVETRLEVTAEGKRTYTVNGTVKRRLSDVAGMIPSVVFTPDDLGLVKGAAERRRDTLDAVGAILWSAYGSTASDYAKAVRQRNRLIREEAHTETIEPWTEQVIGLGGRLLALRLRLLARMRGAIQETYGSIAGGEALTVRYADAQQLPPDALENGLEQEEAATYVRETIERRAADEARRRITLGGPHRDDVVFEIDGKDARVFASQGQQRSVALAWKVAELRTLQDVTDRLPVLLLDDVMSELDEGRRAALTDLVGEETQTFITTTNLGYFDPATLARAEVFELP